MRGVKQVCVAAAAAAVMVLSAAAAEAGIYVSVTGAKQGQFKQETPREKHKNKMEAVAFSFEVASPRDAASGQASGKRQYKPLMITKRIGPATPQLFQALTTNEALPTVLLEFTATDKNGEEYVSYTIKLVNASVTSIRQHTQPAAAGSAGTHDAPQMEEIGFTFQRIEIESKDGKTMAVDDWHQKS